MVDLYFCMLILRLRKKEEKTNHVSQTVTPRLRPRTRSRRRSSPALRRRAPPPSSLASRPPAVTWRLPPLASLALLPLVPLPLLAGTALLARSGVPLLATPSGPTSPPRRLSGRLLSPRPTRILQATGEGKTSKTEIEGLGIVWAWLCAILFGQRWAFLGLQIFSSSTWVKFGDTYEGKILFS